MTTVSSEERQERKTERKKRGEENKRRGGFEGEGDCFLIHIFLFLSLSPSVAASNANPAFKSRQKHWFNIFSPVSLWSRNRSLVRSRRTEENDGGDIKRKRVVDDNRHNLLSRSLLLFLPFHQPPFLNRSHDTSPELHPYVVLTPNAEQLMAQFHLAFLVIRLHSSPGSHLRASSFFTRGKRREGMTERVVAVV